ncbi:GerAB/ArcD/ProY family transporter [Alkalihalobacterium sp. APHAB7]|uniref:GerAB/ArcD/ProY family transporter n=1 Tax=Alkalihalobacterium sp. APHAB7 TaxID=3402081 RepID=UPI003AAAA258
MEVVQEKKLQPIQIAILIYMVEVGIFLFNIPRLIAQIHGTNGWLSLFGYTLLASFNIWLIYMVFKLGNGKSILLILNQSFSSWIMKPLYLLFALFWGLLACLIIKQYIFIVQVIAFPTTPTYYILIIILITVFFITINGIFNIVKTTTIFFFLSIWVSFVGLYYFLKIEWGDFTTFLFKANERQFKDSVEIYGGFVGYELSLFLFPFVKKGNSFLKALLAGNLYTTFIYLYTSIICFGFFSFGQLQHLLYPTLQLYSYLEFPFLVRIENLIFSVFLFKVIVTSVLYYWAGTQLVQEVLPRVKEKWLTFFIIFISFFIALGAYNSIEVASWLKIVVVIEIGVAFILPILLIILLKRQARNHAYEN